MVEDIATSAAVLEVVLSDFGLRCRLYAYSWPLLTTRAESHSNRKIQCAPERLWAGCEMRYSFA